MNWNENKLARRLVMLILSLLVTPFEATKRRRRLRISSDDSSPMMQFNSLVKLDVQPPDQIVGGECLGLFLPK